MKMLLLFIKEHTIKIFIRFSPKVKTPMSSLVHTSLKLFSLNLAEAEAEFHGVRLQSSQSRFRLKWN